MHRTLRPLPIAGVIPLAGCGDGTHPRQLVGTLVHDSTTVSGVRRTVDTLELKPAGQGSGRYRVYSYPLSARIDGSLDTTVIDPGPRSMKWDVARNEDGRHLCLSDADPRSKRVCQPVRVVPETEIQWGAVRFLRAR